MLAVLLVCAAPVIASYLAYFGVVRPEGRSNYGELIVPPRPMPASLALADLRGAPGRAAGLQGQWLLVVVAGGACDAVCERHLWLQRQLHETLGREKDRVDKLWLVDDAAAPRAETLAAIGAGLGRGRGADAGDRAPGRPRGAGRLARAGGRARARGPSLHRRSARRLDDARPGRGRSGEAEARRREAAARLGGLGPGRPMSDPAAGYDLAPLLGVAALGLAIALAPLAWFWSQRRHAAPAARLRALALLTLFLCFDLVLLGAFTRLSDSGLGCPDWPGCYGHASPLGASTHIAQAQAAVPDRSGDPRQGLDRDGASLLGLGDRRARDRRSPRWRSSNGGGGGSTPRRPGRWRRWSGSSPRARSAR